MGFWILKTIFDSLIPIRMIIPDNYLIKNAQNEIKKDFVYRSSMSTKSKDTLEFAYQHCGKLLLPLG